MVDQLTKEKKDMTVDPPLYVVSKEDIFLREKIEDNVFGNPPLIISCCYSTGSIFPTLSQSFILKERLIPCCRSPDYVFFTY